MSGMPGIDVSSRYRYNDVVYSKNKQYTDMLTFLRPYALSNDTKLDIKANVCNINPLSKGRYYIPSDIIPNFMQYLEDCRKDKLILNFTEMQYSDVENGIGSGIMYDFDILTDTDEDIIMNMNMQHIIEAIYKEIIEVLDFSILNNIKEIHYIAVIKKTIPVLKESINKYKHGFHIIIPNIMITRPVKKFIFGRLLESKHLNLLFKEYGLSLKECLDSGSVSVPVHFIGSCKPDSIPYELHCIYCIQFIDGIQFNSVYSELNWQNSFDNYVYEFSLNHQYEGANAKVKKRQYSPKKEYFSEIQFLTSNSNSTFDIELERANQDIALRSLYVPDMKHTKSILGLLSIERLTDRNSWRDVIFALASLGNDMKPLGIWVSKRVPEKYDAYGFEQIWEEAINYRGSNKLTEKSLKYWARLDSPELYNKYYMASTCDIIRKDAKDPARLGRLNHYEIAKYLHHLFGTKFATDSDNGKYIWYEFVTESAVDLYESNEIYKWKCIGEKPATLYTYISEKLRDFIAIIILEIDFNINNSDNPSVNEFLTAVKKQLNLSIRQLSSNGFKTGVLKEAEVKFSRTGFIKSLDTHPAVMGVANGVLEFEGSNARLIQSYHNYKISKFTKTEYIEYDENNHHIQRVYKVLKDLFPEDEMDVFEFLMMLLSTSLDGFPKESIILILTGCGANGKSFLIEFVRETLGEDYIVKQNITYLTGSRPGASNADTATMSLKNARLAYYSETNPGDVLNTARLKEVTGNETISSRALYKNQESFKPNCNHIAMTNHNFIINTTEHATWRRILTVSFKMVFVDKLTGESNYERLADPDIIRNFASNPYNKSALLAILVHYRKKLYDEYGGNLLHVPKPTIDRETHIYRNKQDVFNRFLDERAYKSEGKTSTIDEIVSTYRTWYKSLVGNQLAGVNNTNDIIKAKFMSSKISKYIKKHNGDDVLTDVRLLEEGWRPEEHETPLFR